MRSSEILCTHYALRAKRYDGKYASKQMTKALDVNCAVLPKQFVNVYYKNLFIFTKI